MPRHDYRCDECGAEVEIVHPISSPPPEAIDCSTCLGRAARVFDFSNVQVCVRGVQRDFKLDASHVPVGWERGNTDAQQQEARYTKIVAETGARARAVDKQAIKGGIRHIATVPRELHRARTNQFGKDYLDPGSQSTSELKEKLKADGLLFKN